MTEDNRVCAKEVINRNTLRKIQEELPKRLQEAGFHIERGKVNSEAVHRTVKQYKAEMEKEKAELAITIQGQKQELQKLATVKTEIKSVEKISIGKTILGGKITVEEKDYKKLTSLAKKQLAKESNEKKLSNEVSLLQKENKNKELQEINTNLSAQLQREKSMSHRLSMKSLQAEIYELRRFKQKAKEFMKKRGIYDYFHKSGIDLNKMEL